MPDTPDEIAALTDAAAAGPQQASQDGRAASSHPIPDLIALEKHRANNATGSGGTRPAVRFFNTRPPGAS